MLLRSRIALQSVYTIYSYCAVPQKIRIYVTISRNKYILNAVYVERECLCNFSMLLQSTDMFVLEGVVCSICSYCTGPHKRIRLHYRLWVVINLNAFSVIMLFESL